MKIESTHILLLIGMVLGVALSTNPKQTSVRQHVEIPRNLETHSVQPNQHVSNQYDRLVHHIKAKYSHVPVDTLYDIVHYTNVYARQDFPTQKDLLAVIAVESSFNPSAKSNLRVDPAIGLTQIRPHAWRHKLSKADLATIEGQIRHGAEILEHNYKRVQSKEVALHAYNLGLTAALRGERSKTYTVKFKRELSYIGSAKLDV